MNMVFLILGLGFYYYVEATEINIEYCCYLIKRF